MRGEKGLRRGSVDVREAFRRSGFSSLRLADAPSSANRHFKFSIGLGKRAKITRRQFGALETCRLSNKRQDWSFPCVAVNFISGLRAAVFLKLYSRAVYGNFLEERTDGKF